MNIRSVARVVQKEVLFSDFIPNLRVDRTAVMPCFRSFNRVEIGIRCRASP